MEIQRDSRIMGIISGITTSYTETVIPIMAKLIKPLSARQVEAAKPGEKNINLFDGGGLYLHIPAGKQSKWWRFKFRYAGKDALMSFGTYPDVSLEAARKRRQAARELLASGIDPREDRKKRIVPVVEGKTFRQVADEWLSVVESQWVPGHAVTVRSRLDRDVLPHIGKRLIAEITTPEVLSLLRMVEDRGAIETAHRIKTIIGQVYTFAISAGVPGVTINPSSGLSRVLRRPRTRHMSAILDPVELGRLLRDIDGYQGSFVVQCALQMVPMVFVRPGELRKAEWSEMDLEGAMWRIPVSRMKLTLEEKDQQVGQLHYVPLARQAVDVLQKLLQLTGHSRYVFMGRCASRVMSENTVNLALRTMGWGPEVVTGHGFRATARTMLDEVLGFRADFIEHQLGHAVKDPNGRAYNRTSFLAARREMMQAWADYLDRLRLPSRL